MQFWNIHLHNIVQEHFAHEESLMKQHIYGESKENENGGGAFSALTNHKKDHDRILAISEGWIGLW